MTEPLLDYSHAYKLCEEVLDVIWRAAALAMAAMWAHVVWIHHSMGKRLDKVAEKLLRDE